MTDRLFRSFAGASTLALSFAIAAPAMAQDAAATLALASATAAPEEDDQQAIVVTGSRPIAESEAAGLRAQPIAA